MEAHRQVEHVLEEERGHVEAAAMGQPVSVQGDEDGRDDREQAEDDPGAEQRQDVGEPGRGDALREPVDDPPEQHGFGELRAGDHDVGDRQNAGKDGLRTQQADDAQVDSQARHRLALPREAGRHQPVAAVQRKSARRDDGRSVRGVAPTCNLTEANALRMAQAIAAQRIGGYTLAVISRAADSHERFQGRASPPDQSECRQIRGRAGALRRSSSKNRSGACRYSADA